MASVQQSDPLSLEKILQDLSEPRFPKVDQLLAKVFALPQFKDLSLLERERSVLDFLSQNREKWHHALLQEGLFTGQTPENTHAVSIRCTIERSNRLLIPALIEEVRKLDFRYIEILKNTEGLSEALLLDLIDIEIRALKRLSGRAALVGPLEIIRSDVVERYVAAADETGGSIAQKALGALKRHLNPREINHCVKTALLLKNSIYLTTDIESTSEDGFNAEQAANSIKYIAERYRRVPVFLLKMALYANLTARTAAQAAQGVPATARLVSVFADLGRELAATRSRQSGLQELESNLFATMHEKLGDELDQSIDGRLLEELTAIAEERDW